MFIKKDKMGRRILLSGLFSVRCRKRDAMENNVCLLIASLVFLTIISFHFVQQGTMRVETNRNFFWLVLWGYLNIIVSLVCTILIGRARPEWENLIRLSMSLLFLLGILVPHAMLIHVVSQFVAGKRESYVLDLLLIILPALLVLLIGMNYWTGNLFYFVNGIYHSGPYYGVLYFYAGLNLIAMVLFSVFHQEEMGSGKVRGVWEVVLIIALTTLFRPAHKAMYGEVLSGFAITMGITVLYLTLSNPYHCTDGLTGAFDLHFFRNRCRDRLKRNKKFHVLTVDLPQIAHINFVMGTEAGNQLLTATASMLMKVNRKNLVFRTSGKRFLVMCPSKNHLDAVRDEAVIFFNSRLALNGEEAISPHAVLCTISDAHELGTSSNLLGYEEYLEKDIKWKNETFLVDGNQTYLKGYHYYQEVERFLETAVEQDLFEVAFQPVYSLDRGCYVTMEALSRLNHPALGPVSPQVFIDIAEKNDLIAQIAMLQLKRVCRFFCENPNLLTQFQNVKINVSSVELMRPGHIDAMIAEIKYCGLPTKFFQFEITESMAIEHGKLLDDAVQQFAREGIGLCLDDFGSGYANLNAVMQLPFHTIKLDRSLLFGICSDGRVASLYQSLVVSLHNLGFTVLSEGVETGEELELVSQWGVDMIQGYYFSKPLAGHLLKQVVSEVS